MKAWKKTILFSVVTILLLAGISRMNRTATTSRIDAPSDAGKPSTVLHASNLREWLAGDQADLSEGIELARQRGARMRELIRTNPERAIRTALSLSEWQDLPSEFRKHVERPFSAVANVEVLIACGPDSSETFIRTRLPDGDELETHVYGRRNSIDTKHGIPVQGIEIDGVGALRPEVFQLLDAEEETAALARYPVVMRDPGGGSVAALAGGRIFYFKDLASYEEANSRIAQLELLPGPDSGAQALFARLDALIVDGEIDFNALQEAAVEAAEAWSGTARDMYVILVDFPDNTGQPADPAAFSNALNATVAQQIWEMSYGKTYIDAVVNTNTYRMPLSSSSYTNDVELLHTNAATLAINDGADLSPYETVCILFPHVDGFSWAGLASVGGDKLWLNSYTNSKVVTHELGHNYGARHAEFWSVAAGNPVDPAGSVIEYGDFTDIMGGGGLPEGHFNCWHKNHIGWLDSTNWLAVSTSGTYRVYRSDSYQTIGAVRGLEVEKGAGDQYWVGLRQEYPDYERFSRGAYVLWKKSGDNRSFLLDMTPESGDGKYDGGLALGQTYSDAAAGVHMTAVARGGQTSNAWMDITVSLGTFPGNSPPTASLNGPTNLGVREGALFSVTASDADGDELAYYWDIGDGLVKPNASTLPAAWLSAGTATVNCVVSDMKGGTNVVSQNVVLSDPLDNWVKRATGIGPTTNLNDICLGNGRLVAVGTKATTAYSDDGTNWTVHASGNVFMGNVYFEGVVHDGSQFVAAGLDYDFDAPAGWEQVIFTSPDGSYWTQQYQSDDGSGTPVSFNDIAFGNGTYVAVGDNGTIVNSSNGTSWSAATSGTATDLQGISYGDGVFVAVGDEGGSTPHVVLTSPDGTSWTDHTSGTVLAASRWMVHIEYCNDRFLAGGWFADVLYSTNQGVDFAMDTDNGYDLTSFAFGDGVYFAAGRDVPNGSADINLVSLDGASWTALSTPSQDDRNAAVYFNGTFITVGDNGSIWQSDPVGSSGGGFAVWQLDNSDVLGLNRDPFDDADWDGFWNIWEYAMGSLATDAGSVPSPAVTGESGGYFTVTYPRDGIAPDIDYTVERASNLVSNDFTSANAVVIEDTDTNLTARSVYLMSSQTNEYMRLNLELK